MTKGENTLAVIIRTARVRKGLTQQAVARAAGVSRGQLANTEQGENVSVEFLQKLAPVLGLTHIAIGGGVTLTHGTPVDALQMLAALDVMAEQIEVMRGVATNFLLSSDHELVEANAVAAFASEYDAMSEDQARRATAATNRLASTTGTRNLADVDRPPRANRKRPRTVRRRTS